MSLKFPYIIEGVVLLIMNNKKTYVDSDFSESAFSFASIKQGGFFQCLTHRSRHLTQLNNLFRWRRNGQSPAGQVSKTKFWYNLLYQNSAEGVWYASAICEGHQGSILLV